MIWKRLLSITVGGSFILISFFTRLCCILCVEGTDTVNKCVFMYLSVCICMCVHTCTFLQACSCELTCVRDSVCVACVCFCPEVCVAFCYLPCARVCSYQAGHSRGPPSSCRSQQATTSPERLWCTGPLSHQTSAPLEYRSGCSPRKSKRREAKACW